MNLRMLLHELAVIAVEIGEDSSAFEDKYREIESALQEATRWIPVGERFPDISDCPNEKEPYVIARINGRLYGLVRITEFTGYPYDEWKRIDIPSLPLPVPPEGGTK